MKFLLTLALMFAATMAHADTPNLTLKVNFMNLTFEFGDCYSSVVNDGRLGSVNTDCSILDISQYQPDPTSYRSGSQRWIMRANWNDFRLFSANQCRLVNDTQTLGLRTIELTCTDLVPSDPNECGNVPCP